MDCHNNTFGHNVRSSFCSGLRSLGNPLNRNAGRQTYVDIHIKASGPNLMPYILLIAVIGVLLLYVSDAIPLSNVGGPMVIALVFFAAALAVASTHTRKAA